MSPGALDPAIPIVLLASAPWDTPAPVNVHQIARRLGARGHRVLFVESTGLRPPALRSGHDRRRVVARLRSAFAAPREGAPGVRVLSPLAVPAWYSPSMLKNASESTPMKARISSSEWVAASRERLSGVSMP